MEVFRNPKQRNMLQIDDSMQDPIDLQFNKDLRYLRSGARSNKINYTNGKPYEANETTKPMKTMKPWNLWNHETNKTCMKPMKPWNYETHETKEIKETTKITFQFRS